LERARLEQLREELLFRNISEVVRAACNQYRTDVVPAVAFAPGSQDYVEDQTSFLVKVPKNVKKSQTQSDDNQK
jgi:16S rRNA U1498 N3-methylase RsmE